MAGAMPFAHQPMIESRLQDTMIENGVSRLMIDFCNNITKKPPPERVTALSSMVARLAGFRYLRVVFALLFLRVFFQRESVAFDGVINGFRESG